ncbi:hypothetical protein BU23DRAFT_657040 [Bimuria novae-zelandiae CBS 107.79]|uniref:C2H2-type domain-containing protein n=1 Tax=Bimuria novae-zelandiae CBS 107.79 TaxID=1447943 RepID=A0A6A5VK98_9PLEO|nr:hypothetical protein BU23DRAFT_657040 [Bimuria novae-zelandiae CBS 107.79]
MVGRATAMYHCALCPASFPSKNTYNRHIESHEEQAAPQLPCPVCSFKFADSYAFELHKTQTGHSAQEYRCDKCGETHQTEKKLKQHRQFPSPCYADISPTGPIRHNSVDRGPQQSPTTMPAPAMLQGGYVDLDALVSGSRPSFLPYGDAPDPSTRSTTPSNASGIFCHDCKKSFASQALYNRHCLSCKVQRWAVGQQAPPAPQKENQKIDRPSDITPARSRAEAARPIQSERNGSMFARLHQAPPIALTTPARHPRTTAPPVAPQVSSGLPCGIGGCMRSFASVAALGQHQKDSHSSLICDIRDCGKVFKTESELNLHKQTIHRTSFPCGINNCGDSFQSQTALEKHQKDAHKDFICGVGGCRSKFSTEVALESHKKAVHTVVCNVRGCEKSFATEAELKQHKKDGHSFGSEGSGTQGRPSRPVSVASSRPAALLTPPLTASGSASHSHTTPAAQSTSAQTAPARSAATASPSSQTASLGSFSCDVRGCGMTFRSEAGLNVHKADSHSVGGQGLDLRGRDSWMLPQNVRNQLREAGVRRPPGPPPQQSRRAPMDNGRRAPAPAASVPRHPPAFIGTAHRPPQNQAHTSLPPANASSSALSIGGPAEIEQANQLHGSIMRLLINADFDIRHDGCIVYDGMSWIRICVVKQNEVVGMFDQLVHLRQQLQAKYHLSHPKTFAKDYENTVYPASEPEYLPEARAGMPGLGVVALCCSKIELHDGREEVVKIATIDVLTGRTLMHYVVCTDPTVIVKDWRSSTTGLTAFQDIELYRTQRFKVLKGWQAARAALCKFVDKNTILLGCNLRSDLDALRIIHGRSVDLLKLVEKAAGGPLSRQQLRLDPLMRDLPQVNLRSNTGPGRDCLQDAYAVRELALWSIKNHDQFVKYAKQKSLDYQRVSSL